MPPRRGTFNETNSSDGVSKQEMYSVSAASVGAARVLNLPPVNDCVL